MVWIQQSSGSVIYDYQLTDNHRHVPNSQPAGPEWLRELLGIDFFDDVVLVGLMDTQLDDVTLLAGLTSLEFLGLDDTQVSDVTPLAGLTKLESLSLKCECAKCKAIDDKEETKAGTLIRFVNAVAEAIETESPDVKVSTLSYLGTFKPPKTITVAVQARA